MMEISSVSCPTVLRWPGTQINLYTADPDASNPTRCRLERPLDTIRSFEAAVDGYHHNQMQSYRAGESYSRADSDSQELTTNDHRIGFPHEPTESSEHLCAWLVPFCSLNTCESKYPAIPLFDFPLSFNTSTFLGHAITF